MPSSVVAQARGADEGARGRQGGVEQLVRQLGARPGGPPDDGAEGLDGVAVAVLRAQRLGPGTAVGHEVAEPGLRRVDAACTNAR